MFLPAVFFSATWTPPTQVRVTPARPEAARAAAARPDGPRSNTVAGACKTGERTGRDAETCMVLRETAFVPQAVRLKGSRWQTQAVSPPDSANQRGKR